MQLSTRQKSNIRHFIYYLVNGTLSFELIQSTFNDGYHEALKKNPEYFYQTACVFINQETNLNPSWPNTQKLGRFICHLHESNVGISDFADWETDLSLDKLGYSSDFKNFTRWFVEGKIVNGVSYENYINDGASFVEQCFAIWTNVVNLHENKVTNFAHSVERVGEYIKSYYIEGYIANLEDWEYELHFE